MVQDASVSPEPDVLPAQGDGLAFLSGGGVLSDSEQEKESQHDKVGGDAQALALGHAQMHGDP